MSDKQIPWMILDPGDDRAGEAGAEAEASDPLRSLSALGRRGFLKALGIGSSAAALAACERLPTRHALPYLLAPEEITPGVPVHYASTCMACPAACGQLVTVRDGRPIKLEGSPEHPLSRQGLCAVGQADLRALYDSERLQAPSSGGAPATWPQIDELVRGASGEVWVLTHTLVSPSARSAVRDFLADRAGGLVEWDPDPVSHSAALDACAAVYGVRALPWLAMARADMLVCFGGDLFGTGPNPVAHAAGYAARRRQSAQLGAMLHVQIEGSLSLTGAGADRRWQATAAERNAAAVWLARRLAELMGADAAGLPAAPSEPPLGARLEELAAELARHARRAPGRSLIWSGDADSTAQLAVAHANRILGNVGATVDVQRPSLIRRGSDSALRALIDRLNAGGVGALIVVGVDPVQDLANGDRVAELIGRVPVSVAVTERHNATAAACKVIAPAHHSIECWNDAMPRAGLLTLAQPTIRPLYDTRHPFANFLHWAGKPGDYREHLRETWRRYVFANAYEASGFDRFWNASVAAGRAPLGMSPIPTWFGDRILEAGADPVAPAPDEAAGAATPDAAAGQLVVEIVGDAGIRDARTAQNPWLRELPDPITRTSWMPAVRVAPVRARQLGIADGAVLALTAGARTVDLPARIVPGQHPDVLGVPLGYGPRLAAGPVELRVTDQQQPLPLVQWHSSTEGRAIVHQVSAPGQRPPEGHHVRPTPYQGREIGSPRWEMVIDLDACTGCSACIVACQAENNVAVVGPDEIRRHRDLFWLRMDRYFVGDADDPEVLFEPMLCQQCDSAPCENVCPVAATVHSIDGLNMQAYNRCVGTRYCANNCPYKVRRFNWFEYEHGGPMERMVLNPDVVVRERGVMEKCSFCVQRIQLARIEGKNRGDRSVPEVRTACQQSCPADAITFGDGANPDSVVSRRRANPRAFQVLPEVGTRPSVTYLARVRNRGGKS